MFQRKFARESQDARNDTFKKFRDWLDSSFAGGIPTEDEWRAIMEEDGAFNYAQSDYVREHHDNHSSNAGDYVYAEEDDGEHYNPVNGEGDLNSYNPVNGEVDGGHVNSYNSEMHTF